MVNNNFHLAKLILEQCPTIKISIPVWKTEDSFAFFHKRIVPSFDPEIIISLSSEIAQHQTCCEKITIYA